MKIFIDPGHGGKDFGAYHGGIKEKDINLMFSMTLCKMLEDAGHDARLSRYEDINLDEHETANRANECECDIFIAIHCNAFSNSSVQGAEVLYHKESELGKEYSKKIIRCMEYETCRKNRGIKADIRNLTVLRKTKMPAVLIELGFLSNSVENHLLQDREYQFLLAESIVKALEGE